MGIFLLASPIYAVLIVYAIWSWRRLQPGVPFAAQIRRLTLGVIVVAAIWLLLSLRLAALTAVLYLGVTDRQQLVVLELATFVPYLPYSPGALLGDFLALLGLPYESAIMFVIFTLSTIITAPLLLLLISLLELGVMRLVHNNKAKG